MAEVDEHVIQSKQRQPLHVRAAAGTNSVAWEVDRHFRERLCELVDREMNEIYKRRQDPEYF